MAKLSARGRQEVARVTRERNLCGRVYTERTYEWGKAPVRCGLTAGHAGDCARESLTSWEREERALMSDGKVLSKLTVIFPDSVTGTQRHDYGWKIRGTLKARITADAWRETYTRAGWEAA